MPTNQLYADQKLPVRGSIQASHQEGIAGFGSAGTWFDGAQRIAMLRAVRQAGQCLLCQQRKQSLSPYTLQGVHEHDGELPDNVIEVVHRIKTDSGRLTRRWFDRVIQTGLSEPEYVEIVSLVATSIILDSFALGIGAGLISPPAAQAGQPTREVNKEVFDGGAWVPIMDVVQEETDTGLPSAPNIFRSMGLVPAAIAHFFGVMRAHYSLSELDFALSRSQIELIAARVSSLNQCFY